MRCSASPATPASRTSRRRFAGSRASCTPTSTRTTRRPRRSSRRPPRPTRSSPTPSAAPPMTATATRVCAPAASRPTSTRSARSAICSTLSSAAAARSAARDALGGDIAVAAEISLSEASDGSYGRGVLRGDRPLRALSRQRRRAGHADRALLALWRRRPAAGRRAHARSGRCCAPSSAMPATATAACPQTPCGECRGRGRLTVKRSEQVARPGWYRRRSAHPRQRPRPRRRARRRRRRPVRARARAPATSVSCAKATT